jgi:hypothetical protein
VEDEPTAVVATGLDEVVVEAETLESATPYGD